MENLKADTGQGVNIEERLVLSGIGCEGRHAALSAGSARAKPRRYSAALDAWPRAVKNARFFETLSALLSRAPGRGQAVADAPGMVPELGQHDKQ